MQTPKDITMNIIKDNSRVVDFTRMITEQQKFVQQASRFAGSKPSKTELAYIAEQQDKLTQLEDIVKSWVWEAFQDNDTVEKSYHWNKLIENFSITVVVEKKT
jgi:hypothetical protein